MSKFAQYVVQASSGARGSSLDPAVVADIVGEVTGMKPGTPVTLRMVKLCLVGEDSGQKARKAAAKAAGKTFYPPHAQAVKILDGLVEKGILKKTNRHYVRV